MNLLSDILTYIRRIIKTPSNTTITDNLLIDYVNRFWLMDVDARIQLFDLKTKYSFVTTPGIDRYNMPLYNAQIEPGNQTIGMFPVYQGFLGPAYINGVQVAFETQKQAFFNLYPNVVQNMPVVATGDGGQVYNFTLPIAPNFTSPLNPPYNSILPGHVDITGIIATGNNIDPPLAANALALVNLLSKIPTTSIDYAVVISSIDENGNNVVVTDSGIFLSSSVNYGMLIQPGPAPYGHQLLPGPYTTTSNTINYQTGVVNVVFPVNISAGNNINAQCYFFQGGLPRSILYYNNVLTLRAPPATQYRVELDAYLSPAAFLNGSAAIPFGYMAEYIARGAARKILSDTGDIEQFQFYEPLFREQEMLVWKRSQRQFTSTRTHTIFDMGRNNGIGNNTMGTGAY